MPEVKDVHQKRACPVFCPGTRTFGYNSAMQLATENIDGSSGGLYSRLITRPHEGSGDTMPGRVAGFSIGSSGDPDADYAAGYGYDVVGRLDQVTGPGLDATNGVRYGYLSNTDLLQYTRFKDGSDVTKAQAQRAYVTDRDLLGYIENTAGATVSKYDYRHPNGGLDALGRRTAVVMTGSAFTESQLFKYLYNDRSELTEADRHAGADPGTPGTQYGTNGDFDYDYDNIGNRDAYTLDSGQTTYAGNDLNQYDSTTNPGATLDYDADGNLTDDDTYAYTWDAENRLVTIEPNGTPVSGDKKLEFAYDYMSRRVRKKLYTHDGSSWSLTTDQRFVYDDWNVVLVLDSSNDVGRKYTWGLDLSQGLYGAGGVGGLLATEDIASGGGTSNSYWYFYDGNGNVGQLLKASDQSLAAHYEYDPYGNEIYSSGTYAGNNPFQFSTKWLDDELNNLDLYYYGYRYYRPDWGRWIKRDPIEEEGGINMYCFIYNNSMNYIDPIGLDCRIKYKCTLTSSVLVGDCERDCEYSCIEYRRNTSGFSPPSCEDLEKTGLIPENGKTNITTATRKVSYLCKITKGVCGTPGNCDQSIREERMIRSSPAPPDRSCSRRKCRETCRAVDEDDFDDACDVFPDPYDDACEAAGAVGKELCLELCNAWCRNP